MKPCPCGSGEPRRALYDGYGIFMTFACDKCEKEKVAKFRPDIFEQYDAEEPIEPEDQSFGEYEQDYNDDPAFY